MPRRAVVRAWLVWPLLVAPLTACLPQDTRPPPAEITITVSSSEATRSGIDRSLTVDGFDISIERLLVNLGQIQIGSNNQVAGCSEYSDPGYTRLYDFTEVDGEEKLGLAYALGHCAFGFAMRYPNINGLLGKGASEEDQDFMRTPGSDQFVKDAGVSVFVQGSAVRGDETMRFAWPFRKRFGYRACFVQEGEKKHYGLELSTADPTSVNIEIQVEALFRPGLVPALLHFEPYARADADADGEITIDELATVTVEELTEDGLYQPGEDEPMAGELEPGVELGCWDDERELVRVKTLADHAYCTLVPRMARFKGNGSCANLIGRAPEDD